MTKNILEEFKKNVKNMTEDERNKELIIAVKNSQIDIIKILIEAGVDVNIDGDFPIRYSSLVSDFEIVKLLIEAGADINVAMICAAENNNVELCKILVKAGANVSINKYEAFHVAVNNGSWDILILMTEIVKRGTWVITRYF